jgi:hypothetical protein
MKASEFKEGQKVRIIHGDPYHFTRTEECPITGIVTKSTSTEYVYCPDHVKEYILTIMRDDGVRGGGRNGEWFCVTQIEEVEVIEIIESSETPSSPHSSTPTIKKPLSISDFKPGQRVVYSNLGYYFAGEVTKIHKDFVEVARDDGVQGCGSEGGWGCTPAHLSLIPTFVKGSRVKFTGTEICGTVIGYDSKEKDWVEIRRDDGVPGSGDNGGYLYYDCNLELIESSKDESSEDLPTLVAEAYQTLHALIAEIERKEGEEKTTGAPSSSNTLVIDESDYVVPPKREEDDDPFANYYAS